MTWREIFAPLFFAVLLAYIFFQLGAAAEDTKRESREEAIRAQAYKNGRQSVLDEQLEQMSMMAPELFVGCHAMKWNHRGDK